MAFIFRAAFVSRPVEVLLSSLISREFRVWPNKARRKRTNIFAYQYECTRFIRSFLFFVFFGCTIKMVGPWCKQSKTLVDKIKVTLFFTFCIARKHPEQKIFIIWGINLRCFYTRFLNLNCWAFCFRFNSILASVLVHVLDAVDSRPVDSSLLRHPAVADNSQPPAKHKEMTEINSRYDGLSL